MQRISTLLSKLNQLTRPGNQITAIDVDLMLDYTRVMYADLLELKEKVEANQKKEETVPVNIPEPEKIPTVQTPPPPINTQESTSNSFNVTPPITDTPDIKSAIGINDKYLYISELFGGNKSDYESTLSELNNFDNYISATQWLSNNVSQKHNWTDDNDATQMFYDMLSSFFSSR